jgi:AraC-like DNA-binding protein/mannose-6-phosphate isomerase-like protein (cupin superfamily)
MEQQKGYQEKKRHGGAGFDFNIYPCTIPVDFPQVALHWQSSMELLFIKKGAGLVQVGLERLDAEAGDIFVFAPGVLHGIYGIGERMEYENIIFSLELLSGTEDLCTERYLLPLQAGRISLPVRLRAGERGYDEAALCLRGAENANRDRLPGYEFAVKGALMGFLAGVLAMQDVSRADDSTDTRRLKELLQWIETHSDERLSVADGAAFCGLSESHFMRWFKQMTGTGFTSYLNDHRLLFAAELLRRTEDTVLSVASQSGFENLSHFNRQFKRRFGITPSMYRQAQMQK